MENRELVKRDIDRFADIETVSETRGGKILIKSLEKDIISGINSIISLYREDSEIKLRATIAQLQANLDVLRVLKNARKNKNYAKKELEMILAEQSEEE